MRSMMRSAALGTALSGSVAWLVIACVTPKDDYNQWLSSTENVRGQGPTEDAQPFEGGLPDGGFTQIYYMACISEITSANITLPTRFVATATFTPSATGGGGTFDFADALLNFNATDLTQTVAPTVTITGAPVAADGTCSIDYGSVVVVAAGSPLGVEADFSDLTLHFQIGPGTNLCASASGQYSSPVNEPIPYPDPMNQDVCMYIPVNATTDPIPTLMQSMAHCP
jgi:hypothetical protein